MLQTPAPPAGPPADSDALCQVNIKIPLALKNAFNRALTARRESQRDVLERMIEAYTAQVEGRRVLHLDGELCPLSALIVNLTEAVRKNVLP